MENGQLLIKLVVSPKQKYWSDKPKFAAMMYVVVEELLPEMSEGEHSNIGVVLFSVGFTLMMALDVALG